MKTEILKQESCSFEAKAVFDAEDIKRAIDGTYKKISKEANIKGFRKGKAPRRALEVLFPKDSVVKESKENLIADAIDEIVREYELKIVREPKVEQGEFSEDAGFEITLSFEIAPDFDLPVLEDIEVEKVKIAATDQMVDAEIAAILDEKSELEPTYEERPATKDDYVSVGYDTWIVKEDGTEEKVGDKQDKTEIYLGDNGPALPEVTSALIGKKPTEKAEVILPSQDPKNTNKYRYEIEILGILKKVRPVLTDEFAAEFTQQKLKTVDELKAEVKKQIQEMLDNQSMDAFKNDAIKKIADMLEFDLPASMVESQKKQLKSEQEQRLSQSKITLDEYLKNSGKTQEQFDAETEEAARQIVKQSLVLQELADVNNIQSTNEEIDREIEMMAAASHVDVKKISSYICSDQDRFFNVVERIRSRKAMNFLVDHVKAKEVTKEEVVARAASDENAEQQA